MLDLPAELELAADALLLDDDVLMAFDVLGHLVEGAREPADLVVRSDLHARAVVAFRDAVHAVVERREVARQPADSGTMPISARPMHAETETGIAARRPAAAR